MAKVVIDLSDFDVWIAEWRDRFRAGGSGSGRFARVPFGPLDGGACADFAVIDYTTGPWPLPPSETELRAEVLQQYQSQKTGFYDPTVRKSTSGFPTPGADARSNDIPDEDKMGAVQGTAYVLGALEILGVRPVQPLRALESARTPAGIVQLLESLDWANADTESARPRFTARRTLSSWSAGRVIAIFAAVIPLSYRGPGLVAIGSASARRGPRSSGSRCGCRFRR